MRIVQLIVFHLFVVSTRALLRAPVALSSAGFLRKTMVLRMSEESADEALIRRVSEEVMQESGVSLDQLINPSKVVNLERDLVQLNSELQVAKTSSAKDEIQQKISKKQATLLVEKRAVMRGWLKNLFVGQSVLAAGISFGMVYNVLPGYDLPLAIQVLGFWMWWLFIIPSLRARKPQAAEKEALDIAFLVTPLASIVAPTFTKDVAIIWWINFVVTGGCYAYAYATQDKREEEGAQKTSLPPLISKAIKALDYGSGQERGVRK
mmetsp:Transcript_8175/g.13771  ORF Transcript_8175/g.13771 Transcript_8175/m.13771 type:complete len:264 (+) Transcript_8175:1093-1884(+)